MTAANASGSDDGGLPRRFKLKTRILAIDLGEKRHGLALSDEMRITARPLEVLAAKPEEEAIRKILKTAEQWEVGEILIGLPINMNGTEGPMAQKARAVAGELQSRCDCKVEVWDERLTTRAAERALLEADMSRKRRKDVIDKVAACILLQGYLDFLGSRPSAPLR